MITYCEERKLFRHIHIAVFFSRAPHCAALQF